MNKIDEIMSDLGLSSIEMAKELNVTSSLIYMLSTGSRQISDKLALMISHKFGYNQDWILGLSEQKFANKKDLEKLAESKKNLTKVDQEAFTERIISLINTLWLNKKVKNESDFCRKIGYEQSSLAMIKSKKRLFPISKIPTISDTFNVSTDWLLFGTGEIFNSNKIHNKYEINENDEQYIISEGIPFYEVDVSASAIEMFKDKHESPSSKYIIPGFEDCDFALPVYGHSMYPTYENGSIIMCKKIEDKQLIIPGEAYLIITKDYRMVKRLQKSENIKNVLACSDNEEERTKTGRKKFEAVEIPIDKILHLYLVKGVIKRNQL